jgi:amino acid transporter
MNRPPCLMRVRIDKPDSKINLWLPLFVILPIIVIILLILAPFVLLAAIVLWPLGWGRLLLIAAPAIFACICALRGLEVKVTQSQESVFVSVK